MLSVWDMTHSCVCASLAHTFGEQFVCPPVEGQNINEHEFMSHIWMCHVTHMNVSCNTYEWVRSHLWMSHVTHINESCQTHEWVMSHIWISNSDAWHDSRACHNATDTSATSAAIIVVRDVSHSYVWCFLFVFVTWLIYMCDTTHSYV